MPIRVQKRIHFEERVFSIKFTASQEDMKRCVLQLLQDEFFFCNVEKFNKEYDILYKKVYVQSLLDLFKLYCFLRESFMKVYDCKLKEYIICEKGNFTDDIIKRVCFERIYFSDKKALEIFLKSF